MSPRNKFTNGGGDNTISTTNTTKKSKLSFWMKKIMSNSNSSSSNNSSQKIIPNPKRKSADQQPTKPKPKHKQKKRYSYSHNQQYNYSNNNSKSQNHRSQSNVTSIRTSDLEDNDDNTINYEQFTTNSSIKPIFNKDILETGTINTKFTDNTITTTTASIKKLQWDNEPERTKSEHHSSLITTAINNTTNNTTTTNNNNNTSNNNNDIASTAPMISFYSSSMRSPSMFSDMNSIQSTRPTVMSIKTIDTNSSVMAIPPASIIDRARPIHNLESSASITS